MKILAIAIAGAALLTAVPAVAATDDPLQVIYRVSGVLDSGDGPNTGYATVFFCTNFSNAEERVRISLRPEAGGTPTNNTYNFDPGETQTFATHNIVAYNEDNTLDAGNSYRQGSALIYATSLNVHCSAAQVNAATTAPESIALHMVRLNPVNNSQEDSRGKRSTVPAIKAADDPLQAIYRVSGVLDSGDGSGAGTATLFFCTNFGGVEERVRVSLRLENPVAPINATLNFGPGETRTFATKGTSTYSEDINMAPGVAFEQGSAIIYATTLHVHCSAAQVSAAADVPVGSPLHMVRLNPAPNTQE
jgi:hypothetical protein